MRKTRGPWGDKKFREALDLAVNEQTAEGFKKLRLIAEKLTDCAIAGEGWAVTTVRDTLDGKPPQVIMGDDDGDPIRVVTEIRRTIVDPRNRDG